MPEEDLELFEHLHGVGVKNLGLEKARLEQERREVNLRNLDDALQATLTDVITKLSDKAEFGPEAVFRLSMQSLNEVEAKRFVILNAVEGLKRGDKIDVILKRFDDLGLAPAQSASPNTTPAAGPYATPTPSPDTTPLAGTMAALLQRKSIWDRVVTALAQVAVNALKTVPKWIEIEPHFGFAGPVPTLSFGLKGKGMTLHEFLEALLESREGATKQQ